MVELETDANQGIGMVDHGQGHLAQEMDLLMAKLKAVEVKMEEGEGLRQKLIEIVANCEKIQAVAPVEQSDRLHETCDRHCQWTRHYRSG